MKHKKVMKITVFLIIPLFSLVYFVNNYIQRNTTASGVMKLSTTEMEVSRDISEDALTGFDVFPVLSNSLTQWDVYELFLSTPQQISSLTAGSRLERLEENQITLLNTPQDTFYLTFANVRGDEYFMGNLPIMRDTFVLSLFYNYEQIEFRPLNQENFSPEFLFSLPENYEVHIPIQLPDDLKVNNDLNALTVAVFATPQRHTIDRAGYFWSHSEILDHYGVDDRAIGIVHNFLISYGDDNTLILDDNYHAFEQLDGPVFDGINFGNEDITTQYGVSVSTKSPVYVQPNGAFEMFFYGRPSAVQSISDDMWIVDQERILENYLFIALVDWKQANINGLPYLLIDASEDSAGQYGSFSIEVPEDAGLYEVIVFAIANPMHPDSQIFNRNTVSRISSRFTIVVE